MPPPEPPKRELQRRAPELTKRMNSMSSCTFILEPALPSRQTAMKPTLTPSQLRQGRQNEEVHALDMPPPASRRRLRRHERELRPKNPQTNGEPLRPIR